MKKVILVMFIMIVFWRCDRYATYTMYIDNQTQDTINIVFSEKSPYRIIKPDYLFFPPTNKKLLYGASGRASKDGCGYTGIEEDDVEIYTTLGKKIKKHIWDVNNWDCVGSFKEGWEMTFVITENDLE